jgi:hypothetical protein
LLNPYLFRLTLMVLCAPTLGLAQGPQGKIVFSIRVVAESKNGVWRLGDTRVGDRLEIVESTGGNFFSHRVETNHWGDPKAPALDTMEPLNSNLVRSAFRRASLGTLDFNSELSGAKKKDQEAHGIYQVATVGGVTVEVVADFEDTHLRFICEDLAAILPIYARYNNNLARLLYLLEDLRVFKPRQYSFTL